MREQRLRRGGRQGLRLLVMTGDGKGSDSAVEEKAWWLRVGEGLQQGSCAAVGEATREMTKRSGVSNNQVGERGRR
ncbi:hypothetical protein AMTR_s00034p00029380 [Amborella trichopoda]|uniref:Uncharacterized protein n=1 Tax=Amborella trichopoda TaxID=13333 RepID=W1PVP8_AMBTC|nr:hypothetical protein AMTR_s00034p00029380 [Amborella trichopoda]